MIYALFLDIYDEKIIYTRSDRHGQGARAMYLDLGYGFLLFTISCLFTACETMSGTGHCAGLESARLRCHDQDLFLYDGLSGVTMKSTKIYETVYYF
jgi:hypothetical protein